MTRNKKVALIAGASFVGFIIIISIIGAIAGPTENANVDATPTTVTKTAPAPPAVTKTVEKVVEKTPASCKSALDYADQGFTLAGGALGLSADAMGNVSKIFAAAADGDFATVEELTNKVAALTPQMEEKASALQALSPKYTAARDDCNSK